MVRPMTPAVTVVVPTHDRPGPLARCLAALAALTPPAGGFDVVVVDDGGKRSPHDLVDAVEARVPTRLVTQPQSGPAVARNTGAAHARAPRVAFTDDDCAPAADWLVRLAARLDERPDAVVGGHTVNALSDNPWSEASQLVVDALYEHYNARPGDARFFTTSNLALSVATLEALDGFDPSFPLAAGEDRDFSDRCVRAGHPLLYDAGARVFHAHHLTPRALWRQHRNYGRGTSVFHRALRGRDLPRAAPEPRLHLTLARMGLRAGLRRPAVGAGVALTQAAYVAGFVSGELAARRCAQRGPKRGAT
jgi:GT2 family glycosyltransferase